MKLLSENRLHQIILQEIKNLIVIGNITLKSLYNEYKQMAYAIWNGDDYKKYANRIKSIKQYLYKGGINTNIYPAKQLSKAVDKIDTVQELNDLIDKMFNEGLDYKEDYKSRIEKQSIANNTVNIKSTFNNAPVDRWQQGTKKVSKQNYTSEQIEIAKSELEPLLDYAYKLYMTYGTFGFADQIKRIIFDLDSSLANYTVEYKFRDNLSLPRSPRKDFNADNATKRFTDLKDKTFSTYLKLKNPLIRDAVKYMSIVLEYLAKRINNTSRSNQEIKREKQNRDWWTKYHRRPHTPI